MLITFRLLRAPGHFQMSIALSDLQDVLEQDPLIHVYIVAAPAII